MSHNPALAHAIRFLSIDAVENAQSGHPGMPLGMADIATVLWRNHLNHNPKNPKWFNRDRFVLSNGHGSMLLYALLHLCGYDLSMDDLKHYRQLHSKTPGHPEFKETPGVETTTGPLGQGLANAVGMALAEKILAATFNDDDTTLVDHHTYAFVGDGCLMEGISHEVSSLAGTLGLGKLIVFYDDNGISIDGAVKPWFNDDTAARFRAYHWHVINDVDGHDQAAIDDAILMAKQETQKPTLIICKTIIGYGSSVAGSEQVHGAALGSVDIAQMRTKLNWPYPPFNIPEEIYALWNHVERGQHDEQQWLINCHRYQQRRPADYHEFLRRINGDLPDNWPQNSQDFIAQIQVEIKAISTRKASQQVLNHFAAQLPELLGGSADLTGSNNTDWSGSIPLNHEQFTANYIHYGVREFGMSAIMNGIALHGGFIPYGGTFLVFTDYARNAIRLSAMMGLRVIFVLTHDSIGLGADGPTHQPIEHAAMLRMTPNIHVWRPADKLETAIAWQQAIEHHQGPSCLLLSRQDLPVLTSEPDWTRSAESIKRGAYIIYGDTQTPDAILIATGSEVHLAIACAREMANHGVSIRVVSMPCAERFLKQDEAYRKFILPNHVRHRIAIEAAASAYWYQFVGLDGIVIGIDRFGVSAPAKEAYNELGITLPHIITALSTLLNKKFGEVI